MANILIVDDAAFMRMRIREAVRKIGHSTCEASSGNEAVKKYKVEKPNMVFLSYSLADMNGIEVLKRIKSYDENAIIVLVVSVGEEMRILEAYPLGINDFLIKPLSLDRIVRAIPYDLSCM